jgi:hypothetical protein
VLRCMENITEKPCFCKMLLI